MMFTFAHFTAASCTSRFDVTTSESECPRVWSVVPTCVFLCVCGDKPHPSIVFVSPPCSQTAANSLLFTGYYHDICSTLIPLLVSWSVTHFDVVEKSCLKLQSLYYSPVKTCIISCGIVSELSTNGISGTGVLCLSQ